MKYVVSYEGQTIDVPESIGTDQASLRRALASIVPGIAEAKIDTVTKDELTTYNIVKTAGTKGAATDSVLERLIACPGGINPAVALYQELQQVDLTTVSADSVLEMDRKIDAALKSGDAQQESMKKALARLSASTPVAAPIIPLGF